MLALKDRGAWFGDPVFKAEVVDKMHEHRAQDRFIQGSYGKFDQGSLENFRGCAIGCLVTTKVGTTLPERYERGWPGYHTLVEVEFNIPATVAMRIDYLFESTYTFQGAAQFAVESIESIAVGANLNELAAQLDHLGWHRGHYHTGGCTYEDFVCCHDCDHANNVGSDHKLFLKELSNAPLMPAARALILAG